MKSVTRRKKKKGPFDEPIWGPPRTLKVLGTLSPDYLAKLVERTEKRDIFAHERAKAGKDSEPPKWTPAERKDVQRVRDYLKTAFFDLTTLLRTFESNSRAEHHLDTTKEPPVSFMFTVESRRPMAMADLREIVPPDRLGALVQQLVGAFPSDYALPVLDALSNGYNRTHTGSRAVILTEPHHGGPGLP